MSGNASGRGNGNSYNAYNGNNNTGYNASNGYALTKEQYEEQRLIAEKAQQEAAARYEEMMKNAPAPAARPAAFSQPAFSQPQAFQPAVFDQQARRKEADARFQNFLKEVNEARATKIETQKS